ncbi:MAG: polysaccharide deacetylase family protein [Deltaproteobacteria bacterium]|nr:polysaccharide deacetylase family protein [Deltaproteobacteria bacterium]
MYHEVADVPERDRSVRRIDPAYSLPVRQFEGQMEYIQNNGYEVVSIDALCDDSFTRNGSVCITFDDGLIGNYIHAFPVLQRYNFSAAFFVVVSKVSGSRHMNWEHLIELHRHGHSIQSHTLSHPMLGEIDDGRIYQELDKSKKIIEDRIGSEVRCLSLPFGSSSERVVDIAREVGYSAIFTSRINELRVAEYPYRFGRIPVKDVYDLDLFGELVKGRSIFYYKLVFLDYVKSSLKRTIGLNTYRRIYRAVKRIKPEK